MKMKQCVEAKQENYYCKNRCCGARKETEELNIFVLIFFKVTLTFLSAITSNILVNNIIIPSIRENKANTISMLRTVTILNM